MKTFRKPLYPTLYVAIHVQEIIFILVVPKTDLRLLTLQKVCLFYLFVNHETTHKTCVCFIVELWFIKQRESVHVYVTVVILFVIYHLLATVDS